MRPSLSSAQIFFSATLKSRVPQIRCLFGLLCTLLNASKSSKACRLSRRLSACSSVEFYFFVSICHKFNQYTMAQESIPLPPDRSFLLARFVSAPEKSGDAGLVILNTYHAYYRDNRNSAFVFPAIARGAGEPFGGEGLPRRNAQQVVDAIQPTEVPGPVISALLALMCVGLSHPPVTSFSLW